MKTHCICQYIKTQVTKYNYIGERQSVRGNSPALRRCRVYANIQGTDRKAEKKVQTLRNLTFITDGTDNDVTMATRAMDGRWGWTVSTCWG